MLVAGLNSMTESHNKLQQDMMQMENENERKEFERQLQIFQKNSGAESSEEDDNAYHGPPKPHFKTSVRITKTAGNGQTKHEGERFPHQTERDNLTNHCPSYGSAVKQGMIPQVIPSNPVLLHTVMEESEGKEEIIP